MASSEADQAAGPLREEPFEVPPEAADVIACPECGETFDGMMAKVARGRHLKQRHGVEGSKGKAPTSKRTRSAPATRAPKFDYKGTMLAWYTLTGDMMAVRDPVCGQAVRASAPAAAEAWAEMAKTHPGVRSFIESGSGAGGWLGLFVAHAPIFMAISSHHIQPAIERRRQAADEFVQTGPAPFEPTPNGNDAAGYETDFART